MKQKILFFLFLLCTSILNGQEIKLNSAVVSSAGGTHEFSNINISKWRLGEVHSIVLQQDIFDETPENNWKIKTYPNPFTSYLNIDFDTEETGEFTILITDISGKKQLYNKNETIFPNQIVKLDLAFLSSGLYLATIIPKDKSIQQVTKIQKQ